MAQSKQQIQAILAEANSHPRHRFGQNFMIDQNLVRLVADAGQINPGDLVIEVGPGTGTLTEEILSRGAQVLAVEIDRDLAASLRVRLTERFELIEADTLAGKHSLNADLLGAIERAKSQNQPLKLVANLPYNIASPLVIELLIAGVDLLAFTVQKEVALRLRAAADSDDYGPLTVMAQLLGEVEILRTLPPQAFWPAPKIESSLVRIIRKNRLGKDVTDFGRFIRKLFSARRKTLRKALTNADIDADKALDRAAVAPEVRVETLSPDRLVDLFRAANESAGNS